jgi:starch synthase
MPTIALIQSGDRIEDFLDKIGLSLDMFRDKLTGGWLFNYIKALRLAGVETVLVYASARVTEPVRFIHWDTGAPVWVLPVPRAHVKARNLVRRRFPTSPSLAAAASYLSTHHSAFARVLRQERCSAILCQEYEDPRFDASALLGRRLGLPVFATFQGASVTRSVLERVIRRVTVPRAAGLIIPSRAEAERVRATYNVRPESIADIPNPVEQIPVRHRDVTRAALGIPRDTSVIAWHGRVQIDKKGLDILVDAWERLCALRPNQNVRLLMVGSGRDSGVFGERLQRVPKTQWIDRYVLDRQELWSYLAAADIYVMPSRREGFAVAILEAMACGLPSVASDATGVIDVLPAGEADGGLIVPAGDPVALTAALVRLLDEPDLAAALGARARHRIDTEFSLPVVGGRLRDFLFPEG